MSINYVFGLIILLFQPSISGKAIYHLNNKLGVTETTPGQLKEVFNNLSKSSSTVITEVIFSQNRSFSKPLLEEPLKNQIDLAFLKAKHLGEFCFDWDSNDLVNNFIASNNKAYTVREKINLDNIVFTNVSRKIGKYNCYKAVHSQIRNNIIVNDTLFTDIWYSPEISLPIGPSNFVGFPGLVVEVDHIAFQYRLTELVLSTYEEVECSKPQVKIFTREEYEELSNRLNRSKLRKIREAMDEFNY